jgi:hypothetical protein
VRRLHDGESERASRDLHGGLAYHAARRRAIRLRHDPDDLNYAVLAKAVERLERANRELRRAEEQRPLG